MGVFTYFLRDLEQILFPNRDQHPIPAMDGGYTPNDRLDALSPIGPSASNRSFGVWPPSIAGIGC